MFFFSKKLRPTVFQWLYIIICCLSVTVKTDIYTAASNDGMLKDIT